MPLELVIQEADRLLLSDAGSDLRIVYFLVIGPASGEMMWNGELYLSEGQVAMVESKELFGSVLVRDYEHVVEENDS